VVGILITIFPQLSCSRPIIDHIVVCDFYFSNKNVPWVVKNQNRGRMISRNIIFRLDTSLPPPSDNWILHCYVRFETRNNIFNVTHYPVDLTLAIWMIFYNNNKCHIKKNIYIYIRIYISSITFCRFTQTKLNVRKIIDAREM